MAIAVSLRTVTLPKAILNASAGRMSTDKRSYFRSNAAARIFHLSQAPVFNQAHQATSPCPYVRRFYFRLYVYMSRRPLEEAFRRNTCISHIYNITYTGTRGWSKLIYDDSSRSQNAE
eukprot:6196559-Pleurochrysis_carterae.AAC.2